MKKWMALLLCGVMCVSMLAGCGSSSSSSSDDSSSDTTSSDDSSSDDTEEEEEVRTDVVTRLFAEVTSLDPQMNSSAYDLAVMYNIYDSLFEPIDGDYTNLRACLVEEDYYVDEYYMYYEFTVKEGILWQNGDTLDAEDCVYSIERMRESSITSARLGGVSEVTQIDDMTFSITCSYPMPRLCALLSTASMSIVNKDLIEEYGDNAIETVVGTGAYQLESWESDTIVLTAFEDSWRGEVDIDTVTYVVITDTTAASIAFQNGEVDILYVSDEEELTTYSDETLYTINAYTTATTDSLVFNTSSDSWASNETFRIACAYAIDRDAVTEIATSNLYVTNDSLFAEGNGAYDEDWVYPYEYDPDKAMELLEECGYDGEELTFVYCSAYEIPTAWATTIEAYLRAVGINVTMEGTDLAGATQKFVDRDYDIACLEYATSYPDPLSSIYALYHSEGYYNAWCYYSDEIDADIISMYGIVDVDEQTAAMQELDQWALTAALYIPSYQVGGYTVTPATLVTSVTPEPMFGWVRWCNYSWITQAELEASLAE